MATVALKDFEVSLQFSVRPKGKASPGSALMYSSHVTSFSIDGGSNDARRTGWIFEEI